MQRVNKSVLSASIDVKKQIGFSMVELMIVIAIIGILSGIAIPTYKSYLIKANITELLAQIQPIKIAVAEAMISNIPESAINNQTLGLGVVQNQGKVKEISVGAGIITVTGDQQKLGLNSMQDLQITLSPRLVGDLIYWECTAAPEDYKKLVPANCRQ